MADEDEVRITLRLPAGLRNDIAQSAAENARSMNGEIIARLASFAEQERTIRYLEDIRALLESRLEQAEEGDFSYIEMPEDRTLYVAIDADGMPMSWQEVMTHIGEIARAGNINVEKIEARVFDPKMMPNSKREDQWWQIVQRYRAARKLRRDK
jgi:hypothetical protein